MAKEKLELDGLRIFATECDVDADKIKEMRNRIAQQDSIILELVWIKALCLFFFSCIGKSICIHTSP